MALEAITAFDEEDKRLAQIINNPYYPIFREPDGIDMALFKMSEEIRHERRMEEIREMDIPEDLV